MEARIFTGDARDVLSSMEASSVHCVVTSPPYFGLRTYLPDDHPDKQAEVGQETSPDAYVANIVDVFRHVGRVLRSDGTAWLNLGDSYSNVGKWGGSTSGKHAKPLHGSQQSSGRKREDSAGIEAAGLKPKDLIGIPWRVALALQADGWFLRQDIIWHKPNPMPESVKDRCTKSHEYIFMLTKGARYFFDADAIKEPEVCGRRRGPAEHPDKNSTNGNGGLGRRESTGFRNRRSVWTVTTKPFKGAHFATFPPDLIEPCIRAGCPEGGTVLDPFAGSGTTGLVAEHLKRNSVLIDLNHDYSEMAARRISAAGGDVLMSGANNAAAEERNN